jgi:Fe-S-cluster containining protein
LSINCSFIPIKCGKLCSKISCRLILRWFRNITVINRAAEPIKMLLQKLFNDTRILLLFIAYFYQLTVKNSSSCFIFIKNLWVVNCASSYRAKICKMLHKRMSTIFMFHFLSKNSLSVLANYIFCIDNMNNLMRLGTLWCRGVYVVIKENNCMIIYHISRVYNTIFTP